MSWSRKNLLRPCLPNHLQAGWPGSLCRLGVRTRFSAPEVSWVRRIPADEEQPGDRRGKGPAERLPGEAGRTRMPNRRLRQRPDRRLRRIAALPALRHVEVGFPALPLQRLPENLFHWLAHDGTEAAPQEQADIPVADEQEPLQAGGSARSPTSRREVSTPSLISCTRSASPSPGTASAGCWRASRCRAYTSAWTGRTMS